MAAIQIKVRRPIGSLQNLVLKSHAFQIFFGKPSLRDFFVREHLDVLGIADLFAGIDLDKNGHWSPCANFCQESTRASTGRLGERPEW